MASDQFDPSGIYRADDIRVLSLEHVRLNPGMFVGGVSSQGLHTLVHRLVHNSFAEVAAGHGRSVRLTLHTDGSIEVADEGRSRLVPCSDSNLETLFTLIPVEPGSGREWLDYAFANALSEWCWVEACQEGVTRRQDFRRGVPITPTMSAPHAPSSGLTIALKPDPEIFGDVRVSAADLRDRLRLYAFLNRGSRGTFIDRQTRTEEEFEFEDGIRSYVEWLDAARHPVHDEVIVIRGEAEGVGYEVGLRWCIQDDQTGAWYANADSTVNGGSHVDGLHAAITRSLNDFIRDHQPGMRTLNADRNREGLTSVVSVRLAEPVFDPSTRSRLADNEVRRVVEAGVRTSLRDYFHSNPNVAERIINAARARPIGPSMTAEEWCACDDPKRMLRFVDGTGSKRRAILFTAACYRLNDDGTNPGRQQSMQNYADRLGGEGDKPLRGRPGGPRGMAHAITTPSFGPLDADRIVAELAVDKENERVKQAELVRELFGNPLRPITLDPTWLTSTVLALAQGIYAEHAFDRMPILADALQDAGCDDDDVLAHCRQPGGHVRGCFVVDRLLGKE